jgi:hypothetical protein
MCPVPPDAQVADVVQLQIPRRGIEPLLPVAFMLRYRLRQPLETGTKLFFRAATAEILVDAEQTSSSV